MFVRVVLALAIMWRSADASDCDPAEVAALREHLTAQQGKANTWNWVWRIGFTGAAIGTGVVGALDPFPSLKYGLYASSGKATVAALARWFMPLRINVPATDADACIDLGALRKEIKRVAGKERSLFWMGHIGGILLHVGGVAYVWYESTFAKAALSVAVGYPVGLLSNYTMPRGTWHLYRERSASWTTSATVTVLPTPNGWQLALAGTF